MIYARPDNHNPIDQGDILEGCPIVRLAGDRGPEPTDLQSTYSYYRVIVLTQTCDLANQKAKTAIVGYVANAHEMVRGGVLKAADVKGPIRAGRVFGWYFLPSDGSLGLPEMIVDLRELHTVSLERLTTLCHRGQRLARLQPLYREHLAQHFAITYSRIGLPQPYPTE
jgi:hypothetical protein